MSAPASEHPFAETAPSRLVDLTQRDEVVALVRMYTGNRSGLGSRVVDRVIAVALSNGADTVLIEHGYIDRDWRSEYAALYAGTFRSYAPTTHRLHFLSLGEAESSEGLHERLADADYEYIGYSVMRPLAAAPVGRTMLPPPPEVAHKVRYCTTETVHLFGVACEVRGVPFMSQDAQLGRCAHAVAWMATYYHHLAHETARKTIAEVVAASPAEAGEARPVPSSGLVKAQLGAVLRSAGIGPIVYLPTALPNREEAAAIVLRYLDSALPVIVSSDRHAVMLLGCEQVKRGRWEYVFHDDEAGPYLDSAEGADAARPWTRLFVPVPSKLYLPGEAAEAAALWHLRNLPDLPNAPGDWQHLRSKLNTREFRLRTVALPSNDFKRALRDRNVPSDLATQYQQIPMPRWIWVVEVVDRARDKNLDVVAELVIDGTMHHREVGILAWRSRNELWQFNHGGIPAGRFKAGTAVAAVQTVRASIRAAVLP